MIMLFGFGLGFIDEIFLELRNCLGFTYENILGLKIFLGLSREPLIISRSVVISLFRQILLVDINKCMIFIVYSHLKKIEINL